MGCGVGPLLGVLALLRMYGGWVPSGPSGPPIEATAGSGGEPPDPGAAVAEEITSGAPGSE